MTDGKKTEGATAPDKADKEARNRDAESAEPEAQERRPASNDNAPDDVAAETAETAMTAPEIEALEAENAALKDRLLRAMADVENIRKRAEREAADARQYAVTAFARDMLSVADNLGRAIEAMPPEARESANEAVKNLISGVEMTEREMHNVLERHGIVRFDPQGDRFDPNFHQAMFEIEDTEVASGTVVQVMQIGYRIGERVLRPAMVGVSKGGPKPGAAPSADEAPAEPSDDKKS